MTLYLNIFKKSWAMTKRNPVLWVFGVFVLFWSGRNLDFELAFSNAKLFRTEWSPFRPDFWDMSRWVAFGNKISGSMQSLLPFIVILIALVLFVLFVMMVSHIALIDAYAHGTAERYSFAQAIHTSEKHLAPVFVVQLLSKALMYVVVGFASIPLFFTALNGWQSILSALIFVLVIPVVIVMSIVTKYIVIGIVADNKTVVDALHSGWKVFRANIGVSLEMAACMFVAFSALSLACIVAALVVLSPLFIGAIFIAVAEQSFLALLLHSTLLSLFSSFFLVISSSIFSAWHMGSWTLLYQDISVAPRRSKAHRLLKGKTAAE